MEKTKIDWCDSTWNPVTGCRHGCEYCYARGIAERFRPFDLPRLTDEKQVNDLREAVTTVCKDGKERKCAYPYGFEPTFHRYRLNDYINKQGRNIFVCSMADLFGDWVPDSWIEEVFAACEKAPQHDYLFLTKNPRRYIELVKKGILPHADNHWYGSSVTKPEDMYTWFSEGRRWFLSVEPMLADLGKMDPKAEKPKWVIIGAETGHRKNKVIPKKEWIERLVDQCRKYQIPVFMKSNLKEIWGEPLIQEFPEGLKRKEARND